MAMNTQTTNPLPFYNQACGDCGRSFVMHHIGNDNGACTHFMWRQDYYELCKEANGQKTRSV